VPGQLIQLDKRTFVEKHVDAFAGGFLAARMLLLDRASRPGVNSLIEAPLKISDLAGGGVDVRLSHRHLRDGNGPTSLIIMWQRYWES
jgi:hypothetical protein